MVFLFFKMYCYKLQYVIQLALGKKPFKIGKVLSRRNILYKNVFANLKTNNLFCNIWDFSVPLVRIINCIKKKGVGGEGGRRGLEGSFLKDRSSPC